MVVLPFSVTGDAGTGVRFVRRFLRSRFVRSERGGSAAEFGIVVFPMALMTLAILEVGSIMFVYNDMNNAAREAARRVAVDESIVISSSALNCRGATLPNPITAQYVACVSLAGWNVGFQTDAEITTGKPNGLASATASANPYATCQEVTVTVSTTMGQAALFDPFGILGTRPLNVRSTMVVEYIHDGTEDAVISNVGSACI